MKPPMPEGMSMPPMMQQMMEKMMAGMKDFNPMAMCQAMMASVSKSAEMAAYATPEVRGLFEEWARTVEEEILAKLQSGGQLNLDQLATELKLSREGTMYFVTRLVNQGKASIAGIKAQGSPGGPSR